MTRLSDATEDNCWSFSPWPFLRFKLREFDPKRKKHWDSPRSNITVFSSSINFHWKRACQRLRCRVLILVNLNPNLCRYLHSPCKLFGASQKVANLTIFVWDNPKRLFLNDITYVRCLPPYPHYKPVMIPFCLVESCSQDAAANVGALSVLPHTYSISPSSVLHWHYKREYTLCPFTLFYC